MQTQGITSTQSSVISDRSGSFNRLIERIERFVKEIFLAFKHCFSLSEPHMELAVKKIQEPTIEMLLLRHKEEEGDTGKAFRSTYNRQIMRETAFYQDTLIPLMKEQLSLKNEDFYITIQGYEETLPPADVALPAIREYLLGLLTNVPTERFKAIYRIVPESPLFKEFRLKLEEQNEKGMTAMQVDQLRNLHAVVLLDNHPSVDKLIHTEKAKWLNMVSEAKQRLLKSLKTASKETLPKLELELMALTNTFWSMRVEQLASIPEKERPKHLNESINQFLEENPASAFFEVFSLKKQMALEELFKS